MKTSRVRCQEKIKEFLESISLRKINLLKDAMREVISNLCKNASRWALAVEMEDRLGITMKFLRAIEYGMLGEVAVCLQMYGLRLDYLAF